MKTLRKFEFLFKYLASYILVLVLPLSALFLLSYRQTIRQTKDNIATVRQNLVVQVKNSIEPAMDNVYRIAQGLRIDSLLKGYNLDASHFNYYLAQQRLQEYVLYNNLIASVVLYRGDDDYALSEGGTLPARYFGGEYFQFTGMSQRELKRTLSDLAEPRVFRDFARIPECTYQEYLVHLYPLAHGENKVSTLMVLVDLEEVRRTIRESSGESLQYFLIMDREGQVILEEGPQHLRPRQVEGYARGEAQNTKWIAQDGEELLLAFATGAGTGWTYYSALDYNSFSGNIDELRKLYLLGLLGLLILGSAIIYGFLRANYTPLRHLQNRVRASLGITAELNEIDTIQQAVTLLSSEMDRVTARAEEIRPVLEQHAVARLLLGLDYDRENLPAFLRSDTAASQYAVACIGAEPGDVHAAFQLLEQEISLPLAGILLSQPFFRQPVLLLRIFTDSPQQVLSIIEQYARHSCRICASGMRFYVSRPVAVPSLLEAAYREAVLTRELTAAQPPLPVTHYDGVLLQASEKDDIAHRLLEELEIALISGNLEAVLRLPALAGDKALAALPLHRLEAAAFELLRLPGRNIRDEAVVRKLNLVLSAAMGQWRKTGAVADYQALLSAACSGIGQYLLELPDNADKGMRIDIITDYIDSNYLSPGFSLADVAEYLEVSPSWLSHFFRGHMHKTLIEYVNEKKMERAKALIRETGIGLNELADHLGYSNASSFIRSFKKVVRMTPGRYRESVLKKEREAHEQVPESTG